MSTDPAFPRPVHEENWLPGGVVRVQGKQKASSWRAVSAGEIFHLFIETLKAQAEVERAAIFEEEGTNLVDVRGQYCLGQFDLAFAVTRRGHGKP
jgi:hypothetical protein